MEEQLKIDFEKKLKDFSYSEQEKKFKETNFKEFLKQGFPNRKLENWKFSDLNQIIQSNIGELTFYNDYKKENQIDKIELISELEHNKIIIVDGKIEKIDFKFEDKDKIEILVEQGEETIAQNFNLEKAQRFLVISGPNAGGKSITLKTMGLLQLMFQSGILIPTHPKSKIFIFDQILTDIGDNQSIENQLSTYSYRLKNMKYFLENCDKNTLFLIDEFGTGSDPELGGALAEVFLKEFYDSGAFGIITTHYSNLKVMASELDFMDNANMQFDSETFEPLFKLITGEAGSSYTFEVASKNGIENFLIDKAKEKVDLEKVRFEGVISKLQRERIKNNNELSELKRLQMDARDKKDQNEVLNEKLNNKLSKYNLLYEHEKKTINIGNKFNDLVENYNKHGKKRRLISEMFNIIEIENKKRKKKKSSNKNVTPKEILKIKDESKKDILKIKKKKKLKKKVEIRFSVGDTVKIPTGKSQGIIDSIKKDKAIVNYGNFKTQISLSEIELVKSK